MHYLYRGSLFIYRREVKLYNLYIFINSFLLTMIDFSNLIVIQQHYQTDQLSLQMKHEAALYSRAWINFWQCAIPELGSLAILISQCLVSKISPYCFKKLHKYNEIALKNYSSKLLAAVSYQFDNNRRLIGNTLFLGNCSTDL